MDKTPELNVISALIERCAADLPDAPAFIDRGGSVRSFSELLSHARFIASELLLLGLNQRAAAIMGEVTYSGLSAMLGCVMAGVPVITLDVSLSEDELASVLTDYDAGALFFSEKRREKALSLAGRVRGLLAVGEFEALLNNASPVINELPEIVPEDPAFMFFTAREKRAAVLSHKNICSTLRSVAEALSISSYTFLSPAVWGSAYDCVIGLLLPLSAGCAVIPRGDKKGVARAILESGASALTCTPERLLALEKTLKSRSTKVFGKAKILLSDLLGALLRSIGLGSGKRTFRRIHSLTGNSLKLIICGGAYPDKECIRQFSNWGYDVYNCYFLTECGAAAISRTPGGKLVPLADISVSPPDGERGEILIEGDGVSSGYFGERTLPLPFRTGDMGRLSEDNALDIDGKRRTMFVSGDGSALFPEQIAAALCRSRYISRCSVTGRFDTATAGIWISAVITPDYRAVSESLGKKYSDNRLRMFMSRELERLTPLLPHKINDFKLTEKKF